MFIDQASSQKPDCTTGTEQRESERASRLILNTLQMLLNCINEQGPARYIKPSREWNERRQSVAFHNDLKIPWYVEGERTTHFLSGPSSLADFEMHWFPKCRVNKTLMNAEISLVCLQGKQEFFNAISKDTAEGWNLGQHMWEEAKRRFAPGP